MLRGIARFAGVHLYSQDGDVLYATRELLSIHTVAGGARAFRLPRPVEEVYDLFGRTTVARGTREFQVNLPPRSTAFFFTGSAALLTDLEKRSAYIERDK